MRFRVPGQLRGPFQRRYSRTAIIVVIGIVLVLGGAVAGAQWWNATHPTGIDGAMAALPATTQNIQFTDWSQVRIQLRVMQGQEVNSMQRWLTPATYAPDSPSAALLSNLSSISLIADPQAALSLQKDLGVSPANLQWEAAGKLPAGAVEVLSPNETLDFVAMRSTMVKAGFSIAKSNANVLAAPPQVSADLPDFTNVALLPDQHLIIASANAGTLTATMQAATGKAISLNSVKSLTDMVKNVDQPVAADIWVGDYVCGAAPISYSAQSYPDQSVEQQISTAISEAGGVTPLVGFALTVNADNTVTAAEQLASNAAAQRDLKPRTSLATGPSFVAGNFSQDFAVRTAQTKNATILLNLEPVPGGAVLSQLVQGAIIFASC